MANRWWVGGTGTWDLTDTTHWATSSGGASGASAPATGDSVTFDASSGGGTVTPNFGGSASFNAIFCGSFTGTLDFSVNNDDVTLTSGIGNAFNCSGSGTRTIKLGNGLWDLTGVSSSNVTSWNFGVTTNLTFDGGQAHIRLANPTAGTNAFSGGGLTYHHLELVGGAGGGRFDLSGSNTFDTLTIGAGNYVQFGGNSIQTITTFDFSSGVHLETSLTTFEATLSKSSGTVTLDGLSLWRIAFSGGATFSATNSFDLGGNSGITITAPSAGSAGGLLVNTGLCGGMAA